MEATITPALLASCVMPAEIRPVRCFPNANSSVAPRSSQGRTCRKVCAGVLINKNAPANPPMTLVITSGIMTRRVMFSFSRYAPPLAVVPTQRASVFVAFAGMAGTPVRSKAGKETKLPPPATALIAPPRAPAKNRKMAVCRFNSVIYHSSVLTLYLIDSRACAVASFCPAQSHRILSFPKGVAAVAKVRRKKEAKASKTKHKLTEAQIAVHWKEEQYFWPSKKFIAQANLTDPAFVKKFSEKHFPECFDHYASFLDWDKPWRKTLDTSNPPFWKWFVGGKLNACYNCVDRHLAKHRNKAALIFVPEPENEPPVVITYQELYKRVNEVAAMLRDFAELKSGDRVTIHMPMIPELPITMLACARLGIVHSVVFGGFSGEACGLRAADSGSRVLIYADSYYRNGKKIDHKGNADIAVATAKKEGQDIDKVLIWRRYAGHNTSETPMIMGRDFYVDELLKDFAGQTIAPVSQDADVPLFLMYTSGTTGKPKGCQHRTGGYLAYVTGTARYYQDIHPEDVYWCMADIGWITGHSYIVYGPMALAATSVLYEGVPQFPDAGRPWRIAERLDVNIFHTSPTAIRMLRKAGGDEPKNYNYH